MGNGGGVGETGKKRKEEGKGVRREKDKSTRNLLRERNMEEEDK